MDTVQLLDALADFTTDEVQAVLEQYSKIERNMLRMAASHLAWAIEEKQRDLGDFE